MASTTTGTIDKIYELLGNFQGRLLLKEYLKELLVLELLEELWEKFIKELQQRSV